MGKPDEAKAQAAQPGRHAGDPAHAPLGATRAALESAPTLAGAVEPAGPQASSADALLATLDPATAQESAADESRVRVSPAAEPGVPPRVGRYVVLRQLGAGGMGVVYSAYDPELDRKVAVKVVRDGVQQRSLGRARVLQEAQAMARVSHPNVVHVYEVGEDPTAQAGRVFIAMEFVPGTSLHSWQQAHPLRDSESLDACLRLYLQAAAGLAAAHQSGLIHRDFKPENVLIGDDGRVRVLDFGLARALAQTAGEARAGELSDDGVAAVSSPGGSRRRLTQVGAIMGTPGYMSPEQVLGGEADARSDQFSFCAALYEALYGTLPFPVSSWEAFEASAREARLPAVLPRPPAGIEIPTVIERALRRGLSRDPAARFGSMAELSAALEQGLRPDADSERTRRIKVRAVLWFAGVLGGLIGLRRLLLLRSTGPDLRGAVLMAWAMLLAFLASVYVARSLIRRQPAYRQFAFFVTAITSLIAVNRTIAWFTQMTPNYYMLLELVGVISILLYDLPAAGRRQIWGILICLLVMPLQIWLPEYRIIHLNFAYFSLVYISGYLKLKSIAQGKGT